ncbi:unnamed protein product, partial [Mesorhabditis spiculigera]
MLIVISEHPNTIHPQRSQRNGSSSGRKVVPRPGTQTIDRNLRRHRREVPTAPRSASLQQRPVAEAAARPLLAHINNKTPTVAAKKPLESVSLVPAGHGHSKESQKAREQQHQQKPDGTGSGASKKAPPSVDDISRKRKAHHQQAVQPQHAVVVAPPPPLPAQAPPPQRAPPRIPSITNQEELRAHGSPQRQPPHLMTPRHQAHASPQKVFPPENVDDVAERQRIERNIQERIQARQRLRHHYPIDPEEDTLYEVPPRMPEINLMHC